MKTPREFLLKRHQSAEPQLDEVRQKALQAAPPSMASPRAVGKASFPVSAVVKAWQELVRPCRAAWATVAVLWLVMWRINAGMSVSPAVVSDAPRASAPEILNAWEEQKRLLAELAPAAGQPAEPPRETPKPRSDARLEACWV